MTLDLRFRLLVFAQVLLGIVAFCMAERNAGLLLAVGALASASWYLTEGPSGRTLPRWVVNVGSLVAVAVMSGELLARRGNLIVVMGHFTMVLQVLMLYTRKNNREYAMMLVLSLIQMIGASVLSVSVVYGLLLAAYCALALVTVLVFQLKSTGDRVNQRNRAAVPAGARAREVSAVSGRGLRWHLRGVWLMLAVVSAAVGAGVFVLLPRNGDMRRVTLDDDLAASRQTGFSQVVNLAAGAPGEGSTEAVLTMSVRQFGVDVGREDRGFLLRGAALDYYDPDSQTWLRSNATARFDRTVRLPGYEVMLAALPQPAATLQATLTLRDTRHRMLFTPAEPRLAAGAIGSIASDHLKSVIFNPLDRQLQSNDPGGSAWVYHVTVAGTAEGDVQAEYQRRLPSSPRQRWGRNAERAWRSLATLPGVPPRLWAIAFARQDLQPRGFWSAWTGWNTRHPADDPDPDPQYGNVYDANADANAALYPVYAPHRPATLGPPNPRERPDHFLARYARTWPVQTQRVRRATQAILKEHGLQRDINAPHTARDARIAGVLAEYLRSNYRYSTDIPKPDPGQDPVIDFLYGHKQGHCELFAAGLVAMCRSVNIPARVVTGYRASEFNALGGYYIVRQSHAHAWAEIDAGPGIGWRTFDATPPALVDAEHSIAGPAWWTPFRQTYEYVEFTWVRSVVAYDQRTRDAVIASLNDHVTGLIEDDQSRLGQALTWVKTLPQRWKLSPAGYTAAALLLALALAAAALLVRKTLRQRRRLAALRLESIPGPQARGMARKLRFYLQMLRLLERHGHHRPTWQCPARFAEQLAANHPDRFAPVIPLTTLFYEIRFGHRPLTPARKQQIKTHLQKLNTTLTHQT